uniref:Uncharacterized protein n=1 Tax=Arundo donax TaxID=35708 RepID=A0A0A9H402_ARUDO
MISLFKLNEQAPLGNAVSGCTVQNILK